MNTPRPRAWHGIASGLCEIDQGMAWHYVPGEVASWQGAGDVSKMETPRLTGGGERAWTLDPEQPPTSPSHDSSDAAMRVAAMM